MDVQYSATLFKYGTNYHGILMIEVMESMRERMPVIDEGKN